MKKRACIVSFVLLLTLGCTTAGKQTGFLSDYNRLHSGSFVPAYWIDSQAVSTGKYTSIRVGSVDLQHLQDSEGFMGQNAEQYLRDALAAEAASSGLRDAITSEPKKEAPAVLDLALTEVNPGSADARFWAGEFGAGHAYVQIEGSVKDSRTGKELAAFSVRKRSSGAVGIRDMGGDAGLTLVKEMIEAASKDIIAELKTSFALKSA